MLVAIGLNRNPNLCTWIGLLIGVHSGQQTGLDTTGSKQTVPPQEATVIQHLQEAGCSVSLWFYAVLLYTIYLINWKSDLTKGSKPMTVT